MVCKVCGSSNRTDICDTCKALTWKERREVQKKYKPIEPIEGEFWRLIPSIEWYAISNKGRVKSLKMVEHLQKYAPTLMTVRNGRCGLMYDGKAKSFKIEELQELAGIINGELF